MENSAQSAVGSITRHTPSQTEKCGRGGGKSRGEGILRRESVMCGIVSLLDGEHRCCRGSVRGFFLLFFSFFFGGGGGSYTGRSHCMAGHRFGQRHLLLGNTFLFPSDIMIRNT